MYSFAICEDEVVCLSYLKHVIKQAFEKEKIEVVIEVFEDGEALIRQIQQGKVYDVLFLDIVMPTINGFEICKTLKTWEKETLVVFISGQEELVFQSFEVQPFCFIRKNYIESELPLLVEKLQKKLALSSSQKIIIKEERSGKLYFFNVKDIIYVEAQLHMCHLYLKQEERIIRFVFKELEALLVPDRKSVV